MHILQVTRRNCMGLLGRAVLGGALLVAVSSSAAFAQSEKLNIRVGSAYGPSSHYIHVMQEFFMPEFKRRAAEEADTEVIFTEAFSGSVAKNTEVLDFVRNGTFQLGIMSSPFTPSKLFVQSFPFYLPFTHTNPVVSSKIVRTLYDEFPVLQEGFLKQDQRMLALIGLADYGIITTFDWEKMEDLQGKKIAGAGSNLKWLEGTGAVPVAAGLNDAYTGMQTGVYDGYLIHIAGMHKYKLYEVAPFVRQVHFGSPVVTMLTVNEDFYAGLDPKIQTLLQEVAADYERISNEAVQKEAEEAVPALRAAGAKVTEIDAETRARWIENVRGVPGEAAKEAEKRGEPINELMNRYVELNRAEGLAFPEEFKF